MSDLLELITQQKELRKKANAYSYQIQKHYDHPYHKMNVYDKEMGASTQPGKHNAFILAQEYTNFISKKSDLSTMSELLNFIHSTPFRGMDENKKSIASGKDIKEVALIPDQIFEDLQDFTSSLQDLIKHMKEYKFNNSDLSELFTQHADYLLNTLHFDAELIAEVCEEIITSSKANDDRINIDLLIDIDKRFYQAMQLRSVSIFGEQKNTPTDNETKALKEFLGTLPHSGMIEAFRIAVGEYYYEANLSKAKQAQTSWKPQSRW
jgi:hypothetical protein